MSYNLCKLIQVFLFLATYFDPMILPIYSLMMVSFFLDSFWTFLLLEGSDIWSMGALPIFFLIDLLISAIEGPLVCNFACCLNMTITSFSKLG